VEQIVAVLKPGRIGVPVAEVIRKVGISKQTLLSMENAIRPQPARLSDARDP
jgi:hypothetical protein